MRFKSALGIIIIGACSFLAPTIQGQTFGCNPPMANDIVCENSKLGTPSTTWQITGIGDSTIQGFTTNISYNLGDTVSFKISTPASSYHLDIYRMGYYGGNGARLIVTIRPSVNLPQSQPACLTDSTTGLMDCGNWGVSASWVVPANAVSGIYFARAIRDDTGGASHIFFVVRNDSSTSDLLYQASDTTWQAYNNYGGNSLYVGSPAGRAYKVSYNRPFFTRTYETYSWVFGEEYPMIRWLEANGYNVTYFTDTDSDRNGSLIKNHKVFLSVGHDEYWSGNQRANVEAARAAGVHLGFFSGNEIFWKTRWENSIDGSNTSHRTLVCYKETHANAVIDPADPPTWTGTWRDPRFSPPADGGRPENALSGTIFMVNGPPPGLISMLVPSDDGAMRFWRNTAAASLPSGQTLTLPAGTVGYEWDMDLDNGFRPPGLIRMSTTPYTTTGLFLLDYGNVYGTGTPIHHLTLYRHASGALVFGAGVTDWSWGLDSNHDGPAASTSVDMQQATVNLFADMRIQPGSLQSGLLFATASTDTIPPTSTITSPANGTIVQQGTAVTITGTAADSGGGVVGGVEVSTDGGQTWHPTNGSRTNWNYAFTPLVPASINILSRAVDDSGNLETPSSGITITVPRPPVSIDAQVSVDVTTPSSTVQSPAFSTIAGNELLLALVSADSTGGTNTTVTNITGSGLTWVLVVRTNVQNGTAEIWRAFAPTVLSNVTVTATLSQSVVSSMTVVSIIGADSSGTNGSGAIGATASANSSSGAPTATLVTTRNNSLVLGVGTDWDKSIARTLGPGQTLLHQYLASVGDTFWMQMLVNPFTPSGTTVTINDTAPTTDRYDLSICEIVAASGPPPPTWSISGTISPASAGSAALVSLGGPSNTTATADSSGNYSFAGLVNGTYTVTPTKAGFVFSPLNQTVPVSGANVGSINFTGSAAWSVSGTISPTSAGSGATVTLTPTGGGSTTTVTADSSGNYSFPSVVNGTYSVTPTKTGFTFNPLNQTVPVNGANVPGINFVAQTWTISGTISPTAAGNGATVSLTPTGGGSTTTVTADSTGNYSFTGLGNGSYTVTPSQNGFAFSPPNQTVPVNGANVSGINFTGQAVTASALAIDAKVSTDSTTASLTVTSPAVSTASGNELLLALVSADSGGLPNTTVTGVSGGGLTWVLVQRTNVQLGTAEIWRAFAPNALSNVTVTATLSKSVFSSLTVMSFTGVDTTGTNGSGAIGATGTGNAASGVGAPTATLITTRNGSLVLGVGTDWDKAIARTPAAGQSLVHQDLVPIGDTYWVQMLNSAVPLSGTSVTINDTAPTTDRYNLSICEILP